MWKLKAALFVGSILTPWTLAAEPAPLPVTASTAAFVEQAKVSVCAELALLDGGPLTQALSQALKKGVSLRLVLDPTERSARDQGRALQASAAASTATAQGLQLRWLKGAGRSERRLLADGTGLLRWKAGQAPLRDDKGATAFVHRFEHRWPLGSESLPEGLTLEDDLKALPDPREQAPRISRRREANGE